MRGPLEAAIEVARFLEERGVPYFVIGGLALQYWGEPRLTHDVDITVLVEPERLEEFVKEVLSTFEPRIPNAFQFAMRHRVLLVRTKGGVPVDISLGLPGYEEVALERAVLVECPGGGRLRIIGPEDLIIHKCVAGRSRDLEDVESILVRQRLKLDLGYIRRWLRAFSEVVEGHDPLGFFEQALERARRTLEEKGGDRCP